MGQTTSKGTKGDTGLAGAAGAAGPAGAMGPIGPAGETGTWDDFSNTEKNEFTTKLANDTGFRAAVILELSKDTAFSNSLRDAMKNDLTLRNAIRDALKIDAEFIASVKGAKGDKGEPGTAGGLTDTDKKNLIWCADGVCRSKGHTLAVEATTAASDNKLYFTNGWQNLPAKAKNVSEISNDTGTYKKLMVVGNTSGGGVREVGVWDNLTVAKRTTTESLKIGDWTIQVEGGGRLAFYNGVVNDANRKAIFSQNGDIWEGKNKRWLSNAVDTEKVYHVKAQDKVTDGAATFNYLSKTDLWSGVRGATATFSKDKGSWQKFKFEL